eukprot:GGOE01049544.1.p1 GENE.GGOE01049544.1~~GGOE01049544.1.p1  ORF type:complete len:303 (-),score=46.00 GGOE01049544.1:271-1086(-)
MGGRGHLEITVRASRPGDQAQLAARLVKETISSLKLKDSIVPQVRDLALRSSTLRVLWLNCCQVVALDGVEGLLNLQELYCAFNGVTCLDPLQSLSSLEVLDVEGNRLVAVDDFSPLVHCRHLSVLTAEGNPVARCAGYRAGLTQLLPHLESLDDAPCLGPSRGRHSGAPSAHGPGKAEEEDSIQAEILTVAENIRAGHRTTVDTGQGDKGGLAPVLPRRQASSPPSLGRAPLIPGRAPSPGPDISPVICCGNPVKTLRSRSGSGGPLGPP